LRPVSDSFYSAGAISYKRSCFPVNTTCSEWRHLQRRVLSAVEKAVAVFPGNSVGAGVVVGCNRRNASRLVVIAEFDRGVIEVEQRFHAQVSKQRTLLADAGGEHSFLEETQVRVLGFDARGDNLAGFAGFLDRLCHSRAAFAIESSHADEIARALDNAGSDASGFGGIAFILLRVHASQTSLLGHAAKTSEGLLIDFLLNQAEQGDFALAASERFYHRVRLAHPKLIPIGADKRQALARRNIGIYADDGNAGRNGRVDGRHKCAR